jgi:hypothetical protein
VGIFQGRSKGSGVWDLWLMRDQDMASLKGIEEDNRGDGSHSEGIYSDLFLASVCLSQ